MKNKTHELKKQTKFNKNSIYMNKGHIQEQQLKNKMSNVKKQRKTKYLGVNKRKIWEKAKLT